MRIFVTGAGGHIGSAVVTELLQAGHEVMGLARSESSAAAVKALGAEVRLGDLADTDGLRAAAAGADAVVHLAFDNAAALAGDWSAAAAADLAAARAFGEALAGTGKALVGIGMPAVADEVLAANPRLATGRLIAGLAGQGVRAVLVAVPQVVHSTRDRSGFVPTLIKFARASGVSCYLGDGANRWPAVHTLDLARLYRLAVEQAPAGAQLIAAAEEGVRVRDIAEVIGRHLGVPVRSVPAEQAADRFGPFAPLMSIDNPLSNVDTRRLLGWEPVHPALMADLEEGHYFAG
ncbi:NAD-dependent epimerase/dehydratase family protein [Amycolatopsis tucumanensis]|uniref:NAD-dependent epimerase/dehydratase family protein n=1 Tax=Amycolatopsis tucumanensis TaxID=401106 RepID=UPI003D74F7F4